ncbi:MAG: phosphoesterase PA-phosphatase, partial [Ferruginibacter sp.]
MLRFLLGCTLFIMLSGCNNKNDYVVIFNDPALYSKTVHELNTIVMGNNFPPIIASRNYLYANLAAYEIIAAGYPDKYHSLVNQLKDLKAIERPDPAKKINFEFASLLAFCKLGESVTFPEGSMSYYVDSLKELATEHGMPSDVFNNSVAYSDSVSAAILRWSKSDNYAQTRSAERYTVNDEEGRWVPTPPAYSSAMEPHWNKIRPLVMDSCNAFPVPPPIKFNMKDTSSEYYRQVMLVKNATDNLTPDQKHMADFWDDNPFKLNVSGHLMYGTKKFSPPGHWMSIIGIASKKAKVDFS